LTAAAENGFSVATNTFIFNLLNYLLLMANS
jgi:hypothetical protein